jgi:hypothetical protein
MTPETTKKRGRPLGSFGPQKQRLNLVQLYVDALGGNVTPLQEREIARVVALQTIAEQKRADLAQKGIVGSAEELRALADLEATADSALRRLKLPVVRINTRAA